MWETRSHGFLCVICKMQEPNCVFPIPLNSENGSLAKTESRSSKECEFWKSESLEQELILLDEIYRRSYLPCSNSNSTVSLAKLTASLLTNVRSLEVSQTCCFWLWKKVLESFQTYRFQKSELKEYTFRKNKTAENGIGLKNTPWYWCWWTKSIIRLLWLAKFFNYNRLRHNNSLLFCC